MPYPVPDIEDLTAGALAAAAVTGELMAAGMLEAGSPWAPLNAVAPLLLRPEEAEHRGWDPVATPVGAAITLSGIAAWAVLHRTLLRQFPHAAARPAARWSAAAASAGTLAIFDYCLLPPERRPRFRRWLSVSAIVTKYAVLALVLGATARKE